MMSEKLRNQESQETKSQNESGESPETRSKTKKELGSLAQDVVANKERIDSQKALEIALSESSSPKKEWVRLLKESQNIPQGTRFFEAENGKRIVNFPINPDSKGLGIYEVQDGILREVENPEDYLETDGTILFEEGEEVANDLVL